MRLFIALALIAPAHAQFQGYSSPQGVVQASPPILSGVSAPTTVGISQNLGQNIHFVFYTVSGNITNLTLIDLRLEASFDNSTWFAISDDATDKAAKGEVIALGYYPYVRVNLAAFTTAGGNTLTAYYSGTSATGQTPYGFYNPGQQIRKVAFTAAPANAGQSVAIAAPYGSTAGYLLVFSLGGVPTGSTIQVNPVFGELTASTTATSLPTGALTMLIPQPSTPANSVGVIYASGGASANTVSAYYIFYPPGNAIPSPAQPPFTQNSEGVSSTNAAVATTITIQSTFQRAHLFQLGARCSAGTSSITVKDGSTTIWTSAGTEVGTTSFSKSWNPGLASTTGNNLVVTLGACGASNTGTLDVQGSVF